LAKAGLVVGLAFAFVFFGSTIVAEELTTIIDFSSAEGRHRWRIVNDGVMGGLSQSQMKLTAEQTGVFEGTVSLENNGGFASVRTEPADFGLAEFNGLELRFRGDGKRYQLRLRTDQTWDGIAYRTSFETVAREWATVRLDFQEFIPSFRGRRVSDAPALDPARIRQIGFLISDNQEGEFRLELASIKAYRWL
jgi:monofunctional biosynthetic peptidoglycan transglycosylase